MALLAALSGGSIWPSQHIPKWGTWIPEALFAACFGYALYPVIGLYALIAVIWSYLWFQTGHGNALSWGVNANPAKSHTITPLVNLIAYTVSVKRFSRGYSALFFAVKGFLITLPIGGTGVLLWPLAYDIGAYLEQRLGWQNKNAHRVSELLSGAGAGVSILIWSMLWR